MKLKKSKIKLTFKEYFEFLDQLKELFGSKPKKRRFIIYKNIKL